MSIEDRKTELLTALGQGVVDFEDDYVIAAATAIVEEGFDAYEAIVEGLAAGMARVGELFDSQEYFAPEVLMCADSLYAGLEILRPHVQMTEGEEAKGQVVIGTVEGDVHDIGKNLVKMMFEAAGFTVHDLGVDVPVAQFIAKQTETKAEIVALSALMTTTMMGMKKAVAALRESTPQTKIMVGGAPLTREIADLFGADGYADNATTAVAEASRLVKAAREAV